MLKLRVTQAQTDVFNSPRRLIGKECACQCRRPRFNSWFRKNCWRRDRLPTAAFLSIPCGSAAQESTCNVGDLGQILGLGRSPAEGNGYSLQSSGQENSMDCIVHRVAKSWTRLSDFYFQSKYSYPKSNLSLLKLLLIHNSCQSRQVFINFIKKKEYKCQNQGLIQQNSIFN